MADNEAEDKALAESVQMSKLFRALAIAHANVMNRVMRPEGSAAKIHQANAETQRLITQTNLAGNHKCPAGMIWDEAQKRCVPLE
jgi:hypothetical protein